MLYANRAVITVGRMFGSRHATQLFSYAGIVFILVALGLGGRVLAQFVTTGHVSPFLPSAILTGFGVLFGVQLIALGIIAGMAADNRSLLEDVLYILKTDGNGTGQLIEIKRENRRRRPSGALGA